MTIFETIKFEKTNGVELTQKQEQVLTDYFSACNRLTGFIKSSKSLIVQASSLDENCFILHENGETDKIPPEKNEVFFGLLVAPFGTTSYIVAIPVR